MESGHDRRFLTTILDAGVFLFVMMVFAPIAQAQTHDRKIVIFTPGLGLAPVHEGLKEGLAQAGYSEGKNLKFLLEDTQGADENLRARAGNVIDHKPDLLFAVTNSHALAAKQASSTLPVVFAWVGDPIRAGLIAQYPSRSNVTGVTASGDSLSGKRLEVLLQIAPRAKRLLVLVSTKERISQSAYQSLGEPARKLGLKLLRRDIDSEEELKAALRETSNSSVDAMFHVPSILVRSHIDLVIERAKATRLPLSVSEDALVARGALISYGPDTRLVGLQAANLAAKILRGARPGDLMVEAPDRYFLAINQATAKQIGINISKGILEQADRLVR